MLVYKINVIEELEKVGYEYHKSKDYRGFRTGNDRRNLETEIQKYLWNRSQSALCSFGNATKGYYKICGNRR